MFLLKIAVCASILQIIEISCEIPSLISVLPNHEKTENANAPIVEIRKEVPSILHKSDSKRAARFLGRLAFVFGFGNDVSGIHANLSFGNLSNTHAYSPYLAAIYEPFLFNVRSLFPFNWFTATTTTETPREEKNSSIDLNSKNNQSLNEINDSEFFNATEEENNKIESDQDSDINENHDELEEKKGDFEKLQDGLEMEAENSSSGESESEDMKNDDLFFQQNRNTTEKIKMEKHTTTERPAVHHHNHHHHRPRPTHKVTTRRPTTTTIKTLPSPVRSTTTKRPTTSPSVVPSATTVTQNPIMPPVPNTLPSITEPPFQTTEILTTTLNNFETTITDDMSINENKDHMNNPTEFPGYYGGFPQNVHHIDLTTDANNNYNDYNDIRDRLLGDDTNFRNEYELFDNNFNDNNFSPIRRIVQTVEPAFQYSNFPENIVAENGFRPNDQPKQTWYFDYQTNQFA